MNTATQQFGGKCRAVRVPEFAGVVGISRAAAYRAIRAGHIPVIRIGKTIRVPIEAIDQIFAKAGVGGRRGVDEVESRAV